MSATMMALRIAAVEAVKAAGTMMGGRVYDSRIAPIDRTADGGLSTQERGPFCAVYTDEAKASSGRDMLRANGLVDLTFIIGVAASMSVTDKETGQSEIVAGIPATDEHLEALLDVCGVQLMRALSAPENPWAKAFRGFALSDEAKAQSRVSSADKGGRLAAAQVKLTVAAIADPIAGAELAPDGPWPRFLALLDAAGMAGHRALFDALMGGDAPGDYAAFERITGMPARDAETLRLYSFDGLALDVAFTDGSVSEGQADG